MKTKKILTSQATPGMIVADDVYSFNNLLIINKNTILSDRIITRLKFYSINEFTIVLSDSKKNIAQEEFVPLPNYSERTKKSLEFKKFNLSFEKSLDYFHSALDGIASRKEDVNTEELLVEVHQILQSARNGAHVFDMLHCMRAYDDLSYAHSINVGIICNVIGHWLKYEDKDIEILTLCGLLHDVGKLLMPLDIISKPGKLTDNEYTTIKTHTTKGYNLLKDQDIDKRIKYAILMHHERCDGSGYPNQFVSKQIDAFSKIVAIADVYDAMTSARVYRAPICPFEVISLFEQEGLTKYDPKYLLPFLEGIVQTYLHNSVLLSNGMEAEIILINQHSLSKPVVRIKKTFWDLSKRDVSIVSIL